MNRSSCGSYCYPCSRKNVAVIYNLMSREQEVQIYLAAKIRPLFEWPFVASRGLNTVGGEKRRVTASLWRMTKDDRRNLVDRS